MAYGKEFEATLTQIVSSSFPSLSASEVASAVKYALAKHEGSALKISKRGLALANQLAVQPEVDKQLREQIILGD